MYITPSRGPDHSVFFRFSLRKREILATIFENRLASLEMTHCRKICAMFLVGLLAAVLALPQQSKSKRPAPTFKRKTGGLELPNNATSIRENIVDTFSCKDRIYGYYADVENECQIFHVCLPQARGAIRWSFICPTETVFNQATFVCTRTDSSIPCEESEQYYILNEEIGKTEPPILRTARIPEVEAELITSSPKSSRRERLFRHQ